MTAVALRSSAMLWWRSVQQVPAELSSVILDHPQHELRAPNTYEAGFETMPKIGRETSTLLMVDFQDRLMPAIEGLEAVLANARRLLNAAKLLGVPVLLTEQNARRAR